MDIQATFARQRFLAIETFNRLLFQARVRSWAGSLLAAKTGLDDFAAQQPGLKPNRKFAGTVDIPVDQITGSVGRMQDFDRSFRPLKKHLANRWASNYLFLQAGNWPPIRVYRVSSQYFVEDGHHRVSVARSLGMAFIQAEVWEYELKENLVVAPTAVHLSKEYTSAAQGACTCPALQCAE